jgi:hypothetical protein
LAFNGSLGNSFTEMLEGLIGILETFLLFTAVLITGGFLIIITIWLFGITNDGFDAALHIRLSLDKV